MSKETYLKAKAEILAAIEMIRERDPDCAKHLEHSIFMDDKNMSFQYNSDRPLNFKIVPHCPRENKKELSKIA